MDFKETGLCFSDVLKNSKSFKKLKIELTNPKLKMWQNLLSSITLLDGFESFYFELSSLKPEGRKAFEDYDSKEYLIVECPKQFKRFVATIHSCTKLKELRIAMQQMRFIIHFNNLQINVFEKLFCLEELYIPIERVQSNLKNLDLQSGFRFDLILQKNPKLLLNIKKFEVIAPAFSLNNLPLKLSISDEVSHMQLSGKLQDNYKLASFLANL